LLIVSFGTTYIAFFSCFFCWHSSSRLWTIKSEKHLILVSSKEIRTATVAELNAKRRLTKAEQALAEVS